uniref:Neur_chan_memb domain-containing protein n=1 Tax=Caenorhabditis tropicalis TaxID=1561998 RepID=A0A1I7TXM4_9PELO
MWRCSFILITEFWFFEFAFAQDMNAAECEFQLMINDEPPLPDVTYNQFLNNQNRLWTDLFKDYNPSISAIYTLHKSKFIDQNTTIHPPVTTLKLTMAMLKLVDVISYNGTAGFYTSTVSSVICQLDVYKFPLDHHECGVSVLFHTYFPDEYVIKSEMDTLRKSFSQLGNGEWKVTYIGVKEEGVETANYGKIQKFVAKIQRNPGFYEALVMVPAFFINVLTIVALFINIENFAEKISVGLTNIMAMTFILVILAADLPKTSRIPLLAIYVIVGLVIVMTSIGAVLIIPFIRKFQKKDQEDPLKRTRLYNWLKLEHILMVVFQIANLVNFIILFI